MSFSDMDWRLSHADDRAGARRAFDGTVGSRLGRLRRAAAPCFDRIRGAAWRCCTAALWSIAVITTFPLLGACGEGDPAPNEEVIDRCEPRLPGGWAPQWTPPRRPEPTACTAQQIDLEYATCESPNASPERCAQFRNDPANRACEACIFSNEGDAEFGPIVLTGKTWKTNTPGCIALTDGDMTSSGCGAKVQAASACYDAACAGCEPFDAFLKCRQRAVNTACRQSYLDSVCIARPEYAHCTQYVTNEEYFRSAANLFCRHGGAIPVPEKEVRQ